MGLTARLVEGSRRVAFADLPADVVEIARHCVLDWFGVTLAGAREPLAGMVLAEAQEQAARPEATLVGHRERTSAALAALVNGVASHALDYDDTHLVLSGHPTAPVLPAVLAEAEAAGCSGPELVEAFVAGVELECRLGLVLRPAHYEAGWHATGTLGTFGAAAACARLLDLTEEQWGAAMGVAATQAAGLKAVFGTMCKPFHAGKAATNGLLAARLARRGFTSRPDVVEAHQGFAATHGGELAEDRLDAWDGRYLITQTLFKYHAACYLTHSSIESLRRLGRESGIDPERVRRVELRVAPGVLDVCNIQEPRTGLEGKFSLRATAAMALLGDDTSAVAAYTDERVRRSELVGLRDRVAVVPDPELTDAVSTAVVDLADGSRLTATTDSGRPSADLGEQRRRLSEKFLALTVPLRGEERARRLHDLALRVDELGSVADLLDAARA